MSNFVFLKAAWPGLFEAGAKSETRGRGVITGDRYTSGGGVWPSFNLKRAPS
jgi:hypothetical protein